MSVSSEHKLLEPVLQMARTLDIATNPDPQAIYEVGSGGFQVWCTKLDHPKGWDDIPMTQGSFSKPCQFVGGVYWGWEGDKIIALVVSTDAYAFADHKKARSIHNLPNDVEWIKKKIKWLFEQANVAMPPFDDETDVGLVHIEP